MNTRISLYKFSSHLGVLGRLFSKCTVLLSAETHEATADGFILRGARCHKTKFTNCVPPQSKKKKRRNHTKNQLMMMPMRRHRHHRASFCSLPPGFFPIHSSGCNKLINKLPSVSHGLCDASGTTNATTARSCGILLELGRSAVLSLLFLVSSSVGPGGPALSSHRWLSFYARG